MASKKFVSIPRLELFAAVLSVKISNTTKKALQLQELDAYFWTDSRVMLGYIVNDNRASRPLLRTECTLYKKIAMSNSGYMSHQKRTLQMTVPDV